MADKQKEILERIAASTDTEWLKKQRAMHVAMLAAVDGSFASADHNLRDLPRDEGWEAMKSAVAAPFEMAIKAIDSRLKQLP
jgi:hypothetical protein